MAAPLATCTNEEQCSVIRFLSSEGVKPVEIHRRMKVQYGVKPVEIHRRMKVQYGDACLSLQQVYKWTKTFINGTGSVTDSPRPGQAQAHNHLQESLC